MTNNAKKITQNSPFCILEKHMQTFHFFVFLKNY